MTRLRRGNEEREVASGDLLLRYLRTPPDANGNVWEPVNPNQRVPVVAYQMGQARSDSVPLGRLRQVLEEGGSSIHVLGQGGDPSAPNPAELARRAQMESGGMQAAVGATAAADALTFGGASAVQDLLAGSGGVGAQRNEAFATHPGTAISATIAALVAQTALTGGAGAALSGAEAGTTAARTANALRLLSRTGVGGAMEAGGWLGTRAARFLGATEATGLGRAALGAGRIIGEEAGAAMAFETAMAIQQDRPFSGESWLESVGIGTALGLGTSSIVNMGSRFWRRARATELADDATQGLRQVEDAVRDGVTPEGALDVLGMRRQGEGILGGEGAVRAASIASGVDPSDIRLMTHARAAEIAADARSLPRAANEVSEAVNEARGAMRIAEETARSDDWLRQLDNDFAAVDPERAYARVTARGQDMLARVDELLDPARTPNLPNSSREALLAMQPQVRLLADLGGEGRALHTLSRAAGRGGPQQGLFRELLEIKRAVNDATEKLAVSGAAEGIRTEIRSLPHDVDTWGNIATLQHGRDHAYNRLANSENGITKALDMDAWSGEGKERVLDSARVLGLIRQKGRDITDRFDRVRLNLQEAAAAAEDLGRIGGASDTEIAHVSRSLAAAQAKWEQAAAVAHIHGAFQSASNQEIRGHGLLSFMGLGGGLVGGGLLGGQLSDSPEGTIAGGLAGLAFSYLARPVAGMIRLQRLRQAREQLFTRVNRGIAHIPHVATRDFVSPSTASRGIRRGVVTYYNMDSENPEKSMDEFLQARRDIEEMVNSPELMQDRLAMTTAGLDDLDPELAVHASTSAIAGLTHLYQTMPKAPMDPLTGEDFAVPPSIEEVETWMRRYAVVEDPLIVLERFVSGRLTGEEMETAWAVYPQITAAITAGVVEQMAGIPGDKIRYDFRLHAATFLGFPTDASLEPTTVAIFANNGYQTEQQARAVQSESPNKPMITRQMTTVGGTSTEVQRLLQ